MLSRIFEYTIKVVITVSAVLFTMMYGYPIVIANIFRSILIGG